MTWDQALGILREAHRPRACGGAIAGRAGLFVAERAQWEYACRAGTTTPNYAADSEEISGIAWYAKTTGPFNRGNMPRIRPVAEKRPNAWGLYDMLGNAREWVLDYIGPYPGGSVTDPRGPRQPVKPNLAFRVQRGGGWIDAQEQASLRWRGWSDAEFGSQKGFQEGTVGFRAAVVAE